MTKPRQGPLMPGEPVRLTDPKGRSHLITLRAGATFHTHRGMLSHDDIIGGPDGNVVKSGGGTPYVVFRALLADYTLAAKRGAAVVYPKDAGQIVAFADVFPGARLRGHGGFDEPAAWESLVRGWHVDGLAVRPEHRMVGHTGFLVTARRLAPGVVPPPRRRRPAKGAHEVDHL